MNIFKVSYKIKRENSDEIYKAFGFRHLSDATQYYVHRNNQSYKGTTTLCQPIGEAITLFSLLLRNVLGAEDGIEGDIWTDDENESAFIYVSLPSDWRISGVTESRVYAYRALYSDGCITAAAYDKNGDFIESACGGLQNGDETQLKELYKLLPCFTVLLAHEMKFDEDMNRIISDYAENPAADTFVNLHEDFYQNHKFDEYDVIYADLKDYNTGDYVSYSNSYAVIRENKKALKEQFTVQIKKFPPNEFSEEQLKLIPQLGDEYEFPQELCGLCNAVVSGDNKAVLLHGPAGTGKTVSCKLICKNIGLPIMETINCTENLDEFVLGKFIPEGDRIVFKESYVTKAVRNGGAVVFEEINFAKPAHLAFLNSLLDDNGFVRLDNGETVKRHRNFRFFATMNLGYFGTKELNQALYNRFNSIVEIAALSDSAIKKMLTVRVPECEEYVDKILGVYHKIKTKIEAEELDVVISPRNLENWARLAKFEGYLRAAEKTIISAAKCDRTLEETMRGILMLYKWC